MLSRLSIKARLTATLALMVFVTIAVGLLGQAGIRAGDAALQETHSVQLAAALAIGESKYALATARVAIDRALLRPEAPGAAALADKAKSYLRVSTDAWERYRALPRTEAEAALVQETSAARDNLLKRGIEPALEALLQKDTAKATSITMDVAPVVALAFTKSIAKLDEYLLNRSQSNYETFRGTLRTVGLASAAVGLIGVTVGVLCAILLQRAISRPLSQALTHFSRMEAGDLTGEIVVRSNDEMGQLLHGLRRMRAGLGKTVSAVRQGADAIATATHQIAAGSTDLSQRTEEQAASLQETAASMEQLTATVSRNADNARQATVLATEASDVARRGTTVVGDVVGTMNGIQAASAKISAITGVIEGIAFQTNILALNAAVEAARAGEQGRGFAVVASEVRDLAQRSASAAKEIKSLIGESEGRVEAGTVLVERAGATMSDIMSAVKKVTDIVTEIASASEEQRVGIDQISQSVSQMDQVTQQNAALVEESTAASLSLQEQSQSLKDSVSIFRLEPLAG